MARTLVHTVRFRRAYRRLHGEDQQLVDRAVIQLTHYLETGHASVGLGVKKLIPAVYEVRVGLALRIVYVEGETKVYLALLGHHDEVRRFLKRQ